MRSRAWVGGVERFAVVAKVKDGAQSQIWEGRRLSGRSEDKGFVSGDECAGHCAGLLAKTSRRAVHVHR